MNTQVIRVSMNAPDLQEQIVSVSDIRFNAGFRLAASVVVGAELLLIFQKDSSVVDNSV